MQLHTLQRNTKNKVARRIGRGGKRGKTSGRGMKGQKSRAGNSMRPEMRDVIKRLPKRRGYGKNRARTVNSNQNVFSVVNVSILEQVCTAGDTVTRKFLVEKKVMKKDSNTSPTVKILGNGVLTKKLTVAAECAVSGSAREKIEATGGVIEKVAE